MPRLGLDVGQRIGERMASGKLVSARLLESLSLGQLTTLQVALAARGKSLPAWYLKSLRDRRLALDSKSLP